MLVINLSPRLKHLAIRLNYSHDSSSSKLQTLTHKTNNKMKRIIWVRKDFMQIPVIKPSVLYLFLTRTV